MTAKADDLRIGLELDMHMDETSRAGRRHPRKRTRRRRDETVPFGRTRRRGPGPAGPAKRQSNVTNQTRTERDRVHRPVCVSRACPGYGAVVPRVPRARVGWPGRRRGPAGARAGVPGAVCPGSPANLKAT
jgi:hypothetical protein